MAGARKLPITVNGAFPLRNGPFSDLNGGVPRMPSWAVFPLENCLGQTALLLRKGALRGS